MTMIGRRTGIDWGFVGCVKHLSVNGKQYDMRKGPYIGDAIHGADVGKCAIMYIVHVHSGLLVMLVVLVTMRRLICWQESAALMYVTTCSVITEDVVWRSRLTTRSACARWA